jgi:hypothetical protein
MTTARARAIAALRLRQKNNSESFDVEAVVDIVIAAIDAAGHELSCKTCGALPGDRARIGAAHCDECYPGSLPSSSS